MPSRALIPLCTALLLSLLIGTAPSALGASAPSNCGDGLLDASESCDSCPADCRATACAAGATRTVTIDLTTQAGVHKVGAVGILVAFRSTVLTMPGDRNEPAVSARVKPRAPDSQVWVNDLGYALRIGVSSAAGLPAGPMVDIQLTSCDGAPEPSAADITCRVESCAYGGGRLRDCACAATLQAPSKP